MIFNMVFKLIKGLKSLRLTIYLLIGLTSVFLLGIIIPQKTLLGKEMYLGWEADRPGLVSFLESIGFTEIYTSPITLTLWGIFFLNLIFVMSSRIPYIWKRAFRKDVTQSVDSIKGGRHYEVIEGKSIEDAGEAVRKIGYRIFLGKSSFLAVKNRFSPLVTILFHLSFLLLLIGGVLTFYTKFRAGANVAVGETFRGQYQWVRLPKIGKEVPRATFTVTEIEPVYYKYDIPVDLKVTLSTKRGREVMGINKPYKEGALSFVVTSIDVAPLFIINDAEGNEVDGAYVKLKALNGNVDNFSMLGYKFFAVFYTDYSGEMTRDRKKTANLPQALKQTPMVEVGSYQPKEIVDPAFNINIFKDEVFGALVNNQTIKMGEYIEFDGYRLVFADLTYWAKFYVGKEHGLGILYTGFALMILSLIIRFLFFRRDIKGIIKDGSLHIGGRGEFYPVLFEDEFRRIIKQLL